MKKRIQFSGRLAVPALTLLMMSAMGMTAFAARGWVVENNEYGAANYDWYMDASGSTVSSYYYSTEEKCYLKTGNATIKLDGETFAYKFKKGGTYKGAGTNGISDGCIYINGRRMEASDELRYEPFEYNGKKYLISSLGRIIKNKKNARDTDGYYYCTDKEGVIIYEGDEKFEA